MTDFDDDDGRPDPRLCAALRAAPDADLQAPPELGARILAAAEAAVRADARPPAWRRWLRGVPGGPLGASGAFATVLLGGVLAVMWQQPPPPVTVAASSQVAAPTVPPTAPFAHTAPPQPADTSPAAAPAHPEMAAKQARRAQEAAPAAVAPSPAPAPAISAAAAPAPAPALAEAPALRDDSATAPAAAASPRTVAPPALAEAQRARHAAGLAQAPASAVDLGTLGSEQAAWLQPLAALPGSAWQPVPDTAPAAEARRKTFATQPPLEIQLDGERLRWCERPPGAPARCRDTVLTPELQQRLLATWPR